MLRRLLSHRKSEKKTISDELTGPPAAPVKQGEVLKGRKPPPPATPLDFPSCEPKYASVPGLREDYDLLKLFGNGLRRGPSLDHLSALNVELENGLDLREVVNPEHLPAKEWAYQKPEEKDLLGPIVRLSNGAPGPDREAFFARAQELMNPNADVYRALRRQDQPDNRPQIRITQFRKFWEDLDAVADYWDTTQDNDLNADDKGSSAVALDVDKLRDEAQIQDRKRKATEADQEIGKPGSWFPKGDGDEASEKSEEEEEAGTYTGRRTSTGSSMPWQFRENLLFSFLEAITPLFRARTEHSKVQPRLNLCGILVPLPHMGFAYRVPSDMKIARKGVMEGPLFLLSTHGVNETVVFRKPKGATQHTRGGDDDDEGDDVGEGKAEILYLLREVGAALLVAQRRHGIGVSKDPPGTGKWWVETPRWGGGSGMATGQPLDDPSDQEPVTDADGVERKRVKRSEGLTFGQIKSYRRPGPVCEKNINYMPVGKEEFNKCDHVSPKPQFSLTECSFLLSLLSQRLLIPCPFAPPTTPSQTSHKPNH